MELRASCMLGKCSTIEYILRPEMAFPEQHRSTEKKNKEFVSQESCSLVTYSRSLPYLALRSLMRQAKQLATASGQRKLQKGKAGGQVWGPAVSWFCPAQL